MTLRSLANLLVVVVATILFILLALAPANDARSAQHYTGLLVINGVVAVCVLGLVVWQLRKLWREYRAGVFGSRLKLRLLIMFGALTVLPGMLVYAVSMQFVTRSIESWFNVRVEAALDSGLALGRTAFDALLTDLAEKGQRMAEELGDRSAVANYRAALPRIRERAGVHSAMVLNRNGVALAASSVEGVAARQPAADVPVLRNVRPNKPISSIESLASGPAGEVNSLMLRVLVAIPPAGPGEEGRVLQLLQPAPQNLARDAESVQTVAREYEQLRLARSGLTQIYAATLTLTVLLGVSGAIALAFVFARRLSAPLSVLAEGTQAVAQGDFSPRQAFYSRDELGVLTQSFNRMTRQLDDARTEADRHRAELESSRAYLESILGTLSAGVLVLDPQLKLRHYNQAACNVLGDDLVGLAGIAAQDWTRQRPLAEAINAAFTASPHDDWQRQLELPREKGPHEGLPQFLNVRGAALPASISGGGYVVVFDDVTRIVSAQRSAAWGEVARRLAHEIKNPLTPIQLSAERLEMKLSDRLDEPGKETLKRSVGTIVTQVQAMKRLVDNFRDYSRLPAPELAPLDLNGMIGDVLALYESSRMAILTDLADELPKVLGDPTQLRQVVHNLLRNAEDAMQERDNARLKIRTWCDGEQIRLSIADNGPGFTPEVMARAFEPYVSTKAKGTGLGLAIVRKIVDEHHGEIALENIEPNGARITITLPAARNIGLTGSAMTAAA